MHRLLSVGALQMDIVEVKNVLVLPIAKDVKKAHALVKSVSVIPALRTKSNYFLILLAAVLGRQLLSICFLPSLWIDFI
jgi:hypothetical protein